MASIHRRVHMRMANVDKVESERERNNGLRYAATQGDVRVWFCWRVPSVPRSLFGPPTALSSVPACHFTLTLLTSTPVDTLQLRPHIPIACRLWHVSEECHRGATLAYVMATSNRVFL